MTETLYYEMVYITKMGKRDSRKFKSLDELRQVADLYPARDILEINKVEKTPIAL